MIRMLYPWLRKGAHTVAGFALVFGAALRAQAISIVGVYEKSGFEYLVNLGGPTPGTVDFDANIPEFGGSTSGALFLGISVVDPNMQDTFGVPISNLVFTKAGTFPASLTDTGIGNAQNIIAVQGGSDTWFNLISSISGGAPGTHQTLSATAPTAFEVKTDNTLSNNLPFTTVGTIGADGTLTISLYGAIASDAFTGAPQSVTRLLDLHVTPTGVTKVPEPTSLLLLGMALAGVATLRRRA